MPVLDAVWLLVNISYAQLNAARFAVYIGHTVQFVDPSKDLTVSEGDYLVVLSSFCDGKCEVPSFFAQLITVYFVYEFLASQLFRYIKRLLSAIDFESCVLCILGLGDGDYIDDAICVLCFEAPESFSSRFLRWTRQVIPRNA